MKVLHISHSDSSGGAARAAYRIHRALLDSDVNSKMWVSQSLSDDWTVTEWGGRAEKAKNLVRRQVAHAWRGLLKTTSEVLHSPAVMSSALVQRINRSDADVVNLHWVQGEMLSVADIGRIEKPLVWTLHDMWAVCGAEHLSFDGRWKEGYLPGNRPEEESGFDLNRWTWNRKARGWKAPIQIVAPSRWLAGCVRESALMSGWPVTVIPNPIDTEIWKPLPQATARGLLGLPPGVPLLLFGAIGGTNDPLKGFSLLRDSLRRMRREKMAENTELVVFGQGEPRTRVDLGFPVHYVGHVNDNLTLRILYNSADVMLVPSRIEAFGQTAVEANACGTPVVAFDTSGLRDIVNHRQTGYLADPFDSDDFSEGILWVYKKLSAGRNSFEAEVRRSAVERFSYSLVGEQYKSTLADAHRKTR